MIFTGDVVFPNSFSKDIILQLDTEFIDTPKIVNSESLIDLGDTKISNKKTTDGIALLSNQEIIKFYKSLNVVGVSLANNHITDFDISIDKQVFYYAKNKIKSFGAGDNLAKAELPFINDNYVILSYGWEVISCVLAGKFKKGVNPLKESQIFSQINIFKEKYPTKKIILIFHWDYEFELYPQPAHRKLAFDLIDYGVDAIFGHHSHVVQGAEIYKNKPIFYGLGNFYFPNQNYNGFNIDFPPLSQTGLSVKYNDEKEVVLFWTYKDDTNNLISIAKEKLSESTRMKALTPFDGFSHKEYIIWFGKNRKKNKLLPIFKNYKNTFNNILKEKFIHLRQKGINCLVKLNVK